MLSSYQLTKSNPDRRRSSRGGFGDLIFDLFLPSPISPSRGGLVLSATL
jgi:hypothetical protein